jgi:hypothetical protein
VRITTSNSVYNEIVWNVIDTAPCDHPDRVLLEAASAVPSEEKKVIAVRRENVHTLEVAILPPVLTEDLTMGSELTNAVQQTFNFDSSGNFEHLLDKWVPLGGLGGSQVLVRRRTREDYHIFMFDTIDRLGLELWFHSQWAQETILLADWDIIKQCPACHYWPYCFYCSKFLLPPQCHRRSAKHERAVEKKRSFGLVWARSECTRLINVEPRAR